MVGGFGQQGSRIEMVDLRPREDLVCIEETTKIYVYFILLIVPMRRRDL